MSPNTEKNKEPGRKSSHRRHGSHHTAGPGHVEKENHVPQSTQGSAEEELKRLQERNAQLEHAVKANGLHIPHGRQVDIVPEDSIPRPRNLKDTNITEIRNHMGLEGDENKRAWLNHRKCVRNNATRVGFDHSLNFAGQPHEKVSKCLNAIELECPLFKRFMASWGARYVLLEVWANRNEWLDKTNPQTNADRNEDDGDRREEDNEDNDEHGSHGERGDGSSGNDNDEDDNQAKNVNDSSGSEVDNPSRRKSNHTARVPGTSEDRDDNGDACTSPNKNKRAAHALSASEDESDDSTNHAPPKKKVAGPSRSSGKTSRATGGTTKARQRGV
ncbi:hypothetical protein C8R43DRAFT_944710 [Mycena crocata]|nr:hypothetical protein C8R43DRAFT_944710 [Mycena crocata]